MSLPGLNKASSISVNAALKVHKNRIFKASPTNPSVIFKRELISGFSWVSLRFNIYSQAYIMTTAFCNIKRKAKNCPETIFCNIEKSII